MSETALTVARRARLAIQGLTYHAVTAHTGAVQSAFVLMVKGKLFGCSAYFHVSDIIEAVRHWRENRGAFRLSIVSHAGGFWMKPSFMLL